ncbi:MAG: hypothetical protein CL484_07460 [Acidobacteria bacterium]|nr:hypothetical protein [Acidobacteriota bacterium]
MDINITSIDVQKFTVDTLSIDPAWSLICIFLVTWVVFVVAVLFATIVYYKQITKPPLSSYEQRI